MDSSSGGHECLSMARHETVAEIFQSGVAVKSMKDSEQDLMCEILVIFYLQQAESSCLLVGCLS